MQDIFLVYIVVTAITFLLTVLILNRAFRIIKTMEDRKPVKINIMWYILLYLAFFLSSLVPVYGQMQLVVTYLGMRLLMKYAK